ncbi:MAG: acyl-CoA dehydrogenase family protein [Maritimibacter sp.]
MTPFKAPVDDILFTLNHVAEAGRLEAYDAEFAGDIAGHYAAFIEGVMAPLDALGDQQGARLFEGRVVLPDGFGAAYKQHAEAGWPGLTAPEAYGGQGLGGVFQGITSEIFSGANQSLQMVMGLVPGAIRTLLDFGTEAQKAQMIPPLADGRWLATMCLTEPGAGSDLAAVRTRAEQVDGAWRISGEKIFISGGDQDMSEGIFHLVLARTGGLEEGLRGLSLFACLSDNPDGTRNDIKVTRIEEKMGLHASPTCQLAFEGARAELIGEVGAGLKGMFTMMNHARIDVSLQGVAHAARAYHIASTYASERVQGRGADGPVTLDQHGDVRRMLDEIDALAMGARAMSHVALVALEAGDDPWLVEFLTPVIKVHCTEAGMRAAETGMQVLGGYGYLGEYRIEQTYRDARISAIYEGANGIHAMGLAGRMLRLKDGAAFDAFAGYIEGVLSVVESPALCRAMSAWKVARKALLNAEDIGPVAMPFMRLTGRVMEQAMWALIGAKAPLHADPSRLQRVAALVARQAARCEADLAEIIT